MELPKLERTEEIKKVSNYSSFLPPPFPPITQPGLQHPGEKLRAANFVLLLWTVKSRRWGCRVAALLMWMKSRQILEHVLQPR